MKIRIKGNSLRYRLTRSDVSQFEQNGCLEEATRFAGSAFIYRLIKTENNVLSATYKDSAITLYMPAAMLQEWINTNVVGFGNTDGELNLLIEKDFACLDQVDEDESDNYPNPLAIKVC